ncbi:MAG: hypothetical protein ACTH0P_11515, partial [Candidatus Corynebacterium faecigallinarum]
GNGGNGGNGDVEDILEWPLNLGDSETTDPGTTNGAGNAGENGDTTSNGAAGAGALMGPL